MTYFFIGGSPRSGTTLLQSLLCSDKKTNPLIREALYFSALISTYHLGKFTFEVEAKDYFDNFDDLKNFSASWVQAFLEKTHQRYAPAEHLVLKAPELTKFFPDLYELIQDSVYLIMVRDPRDTIASLLEVGNKIKPQEHPEWFYQMVRDRNIAKLAKFYKSFYQPAINYHCREFCQKTRYIKYESLVTNCNQIIEQIKNFTGLSMEKFDPNSGSVSDQMYFSQTQEARDYWWTTNLHGKGISPIKVNRYHQVLTKAEIYTIEKETADLLELFSYNSMLVAV